ncbi:MAG: hypothetical protein JXQ90_03705 [Cyclobacteriaceae bacterium]
MRIIVLAVGLLSLLLDSCEDVDNRWDDEIIIPEFNYPQTVEFEENLSSYEIYQGVMAELVPSTDFHLLELGSTLFTDYAFKQRLIKIPSGTQIQDLNDDALSFPDGTILVKTFYYLNDERDANQGKRIIESRLLIKENDSWNVATYIWNDAHTDARLELDGYDTQVSWLDSNGNNLSTSYHIPSKNECGTCHQTKSKLTPIGPTLRNLNREVNRNGETLNQIAHLQSVGLIDDRIELTGIPQMIDYKNHDLALSVRGRAYLDMNCAHCHNPDGWNMANKRPFDFRMETALDHSGILGKEEKIARNLVNGRMPLVGTTMIDKEGVQLIVDYLNSL